MQISDAGAAGSGSYEKEIRMGWLELTPANQGIQLRKICFWRGQIPDAGAVGSGSYEKGIIMGWLALTPANRGLALRKTRFSYGPEPGGFWTV